MGIICGACGLAVMTSSLGVRTGEFYNFGNYFLATLDQTPFVVYVSIGTLILGFLAILTGAIVSFSGLFVSRYPKCAYLAFLCMMAIAAGTIAAGAIVQNGVGLLNDAIYSQPLTCPSRTAPVEISFTQRVIHLQLAMFNGCCANQGLTHSKEIFIPTSEQVPESIDDDGFVKFCGLLHPINYENFCGNDADRSRPRSCFRDQETYRQYNATVTANLPRICQTLTDAKVNIEGKKVPGTSIDVKAITAGRSVIPIVAPFSNPSFGCGAGFAKAFQAAMLIWAENILAPIATNLLICGSIYAVLFLLGLVSLYSSRASKGETAEEKYARYMEEIHNSSSSAAKHGQVGPYQVAVAEPFEQANPNRMSMQAPMAPVQVAGNRMSISNSQRMSVQSYATHGSQANQVEASFNVDDKI